MRAVDLAGNVDPTPAVYTWTVDLPPETTILSTPTDPTASTAVTFTFSSDDPAATFECQLDGGGFAACVSPQTYAGLLDGLHTFEVRAVDLAGNPDPTPAVYTWTVDTIAPDTTLLSTPPTPYTSTSVTFTFTSNDSAASFECQLDGGGFAACASPQAYTGLAEGLHTFDVRAVDLAGNLDPTPAVYTWTVDLPPDTTILSTPPDPTASTVVTFTFGSNDPAATFECQLDGGGFMACASPQTYAGLSSGVHVFDVRAVDVLGNRDATPASYSWNVLLLPPGSFEFLALPEITGTLGVSATIQGIVVPPHSLTALTVTVQGTEILTETHAPGTVMQDVFNATWMPLANGIYTVTAMATDEISGTATISGSLIVDTAPPEAILSTNTYTTSAYTPGSGLTFNGILSDTTGIISATAVLTVNGSTTPLGVQLAPDAIPAGYKDGRPIYPMTSWSANWWSADTANLPDYTHASLTLTVYDASLIPTTFNFPIVIDLMPPVLGKVTLLGNSQPMTTSHTYRASLLSTSAEVLTTTDASGSVSMWYGWTESITSTVANLTPVVNPGMQNLLHQDFLLNVGDGGKAYFFHVQAVDGLGNRIRRIYGPYYHDLPAMPDYINPLQSGSNTTGNRPYRGWQDNGCTLLGVDERIADLGMDNAALASPQALHLTWDATRLHMLWTGANWDTDGDLFIYLDTIPGQGSQGAYNPYTSTMQSTVLLLPAREEPVTLNINAMQADYAVWVTDTRNAHLLHWNGSAWVDAGALDTLGGFYSFNAEPDGAYTDLILPFDLIGNPTEMSLVAFAVDAEEGPSGGLRIWSILPYANPADSPRVVPDAPGPDQPHRLMLTDRYTIAIADGTCLTPEANLEFAISTNEDAFYYNPNEDAIRLILPAPSVNPNAWNSLFAPYDDQYQTWLTNTYCPTDPTFPECHKNKPPASLDDAGLLNDVRENQHPPLLPGTEVTYTLHYANPLAVTTTVTAYLYSNDDLYNPEAGVAFKGLTWLNGCTGWLALTVPPGVGNFVITGVVQPTGVHALNLDIEPAYTQTGCSITGDTTSLPEYRLRVTHTPDDGAPGYVAILPSFTQSGPISATIPGVVRDAAPVDLIEFRVNGSHTFTCVDDTPSDGQWRCLWDVVASNGGTPPANGTQFTLQVRATDAFGHQSAWSTPWSVTIDAQSPQMAGSALDLTSSYLPDASQVSESLPINDTMIQLAGAIADNTVPQGVEICTKNSENCVAANLTIDPYEIPPTTYRYTDSPASPVTIDNASACGVHTQGMTRNFVIDDNFTIANVSLGLRLEHPYRSDLSAVLQAPSGTEVQIFHFDKNVLAENIVALFSDDATDLLSNDLNSHALEDSYQSHVYRPTENLSRFSGEQSAGVWTLILCDSDPTSDTGTFYEASLDMEAVAPPLNITGNWTYNVDVSGSDGITYTWTAYAVDIYGNRTKTPYVMTALVDNIPPVITATQVVSKALVGTTVEVLHGLVVDGDAVTNVLAEIIDPTGNVSTQNIVNDNGTWTYTMTLTLGGDYEVSIYATDRAGNKTSIGLFTVSGLQPLDVTQSVVPQANVASGSLVTYTVAVANPNTNEAAENIVLRSTLSQWLTPTLLDGGVYTNSMVVWQIPTLPAGEMLTKTVVARLPEQLVITATLPVTDWVDLHGATLTSFARAETSNLGTSDSYQTSFEIEGAQVPSPQSPMTIQKAVSDTSVPLGALVTYTIQMTNTTDTLAENIIISDTLIPVLSPVSLGTASFDPASRTIVWPSFSLAAGESIVLTFTTRLTESQAAVDSLSGYLSNQAFFTSTLGSGASNIAVFTAPFTHTYYLPLIFGPSPGTSPFAPANEGLPSESAVPPRKDTSLY
ncbi:MAG: DUF11 domain-containing protein [Anaerolineae bacterium]|nr:MAG: DUF11 domain-containing protein [Anaerolineae bacterium]